MVDIDTILIEDKKYILTDKIEIEKKTYLFLSNVENPKEFCIRRRIIEDGKEYIEKLSSKEEFDKVMLTLTKKYENVLK